jgi:hypothetical protein
MNSSTEQHAEKKPPNRCGLHRGFAVVDFDGERCPVCKLLYADITALESRLFELEEQLELSEEGAPEPQRPVDERARRGLEVSPRIWR